MTSFSVTTQGQMSHDTPRSSAGFSTPRSFEDFIRDEDDFPEFSSSSDDLSGSESEKLKDHTCNWNMISKLINECTDCEKCKKETLRRLSILEAKFSEEFMAKHRQMQLMVEYEKKIREWFAEKNEIIRELRVEKQNAEVARLSALEELKAVPKHFMNLETSYQNLSRKYEEAKNTMKFLGLHVEALLSQYQDYVDQTQHQFEQLKQYTVEKFNQANLELSFAVRKFTTENSKLRRESEAKVKELRRLLELKNQENLELTSICNFILKNCDISDDLELQI